jgi:hypothetical protein
MLKRRRDVYGRVPVFGIEKDNSLPCNGKTNFVCLARNAVRAETEEMGVWLSFGY